MGRDRTAAEPVYLEEGRRRVFALAVAWPGWARPGRTAEDALDTLTSYRDRYASSIAVTGAAPPQAAELRLDVIARVPGNATTDFGAPGVVPDLDRKAWTREEGDRQAGLLSAVWQRFDEVVAQAPAELRKGPRGGGRDRDAIVAHVLNAEHAFRRKAGLRVPPPKDHAGVAAVREQLLDLVRIPSAGSSEAGGAAWPLPYATRRIAWHVLDHAWEIEDRSDPAG